MNYFRDEYIRCYKDKTRKSFIESYLKTFDASIGKETPFELFPRQIVYVNDLVTYRNNVAIKPRQCGITTVTSGWITGQIVFARKDKPETVLCIGNNLEISQQLVDKIGTFLDQVPRWFWGNGYYHPDPEHPNNTKSIYVKRNKQELKLFNGCRVIAKSSGPNAARGISAVSILVFDEAAFIGDGDGVQVYSQAVAATSSVKDAKVIMVSTPNGKDTLYYPTYQQAIKGKNNYHATEFRWYQDPRYNKNLKWYKEDEDGKIEWVYETVIAKDGSIKYDEELWKIRIKDGWTPTSPWYEGMCQSFNNNQIKINQELNVSFLGSSDNVVSPEIIEMHDNKNVIEITKDWELGDPLIKETWVWKKPIEGHKYIMGVDNSSGSADDSTALIIIDVDAVDEEGNRFFEQVLEYNGKLTGDVIGGIANEYGRMYNNALIVVEDIGGYGTTTILTLLDLDYPNLYRDDPGLKTPTIERKYSTYGVNEGDKLPGFHTNAARFPMIMNFAQLLKNNMFRVRSKRMISELHTWIYKNGRPDHQSGAHDDLLTCTAMALYVMEYSMLKTIADGNKSKAMATAWTLNRNNKRSESKQNVYTRPEYNTPTYLVTNVNDVPKKRNTTKAMLLLAGFSDKRRK